MILAIPRQILQNTLILNLMQINSSEATLLHVDMDTHNEAHKSLLHDLAKAPRNPFLMPFCS